MHPLLFEEIAQQHIEELHREASRQRLGLRRRSPRSRRRREPTAKLQRAPAH